MELKRTWQRGFADLLSIGVGITILGIVTAGSTAAMVYSREILIRQEHYKVAAYQLRGLMEEITGKLQLNPNGWRDNPESLRQKQLGIQPLDVHTDMGGVQVVNVEYSQETIVPVDLPETDGIDYYTVTLHARWRERDMVGDDRTNDGIYRKIDFTTSVMIPSQM